MSEKLATIGFKTICDFKKLTNIKEIQRPDGISEKKLTSLYQQALTAMDEDCPPWHWPQEEGQSIQIKIW